MACVLFVKLVNNVDVRRAVSQQCRSKDVESDGSSHCLVFTISNAHMLIEHTRTILTMLQTTESLLQLMIAFGRYSTQKSLGSHLAYSSEGAQKECQTKRGKLHAQKRGQAALSAVAH